MLGTFTDRKALLLKKQYGSKFVSSNIRGNVHKITVDAEPGGHRFRFLVDGESRTSPDYKLATDHQNVVVNYLEHSEPREEEEEADIDSYESYHAEQGGTILLHPLTAEYPEVPEEVWTREIPSFYIRRSSNSSSLASSHSSQSTGVSPPVTQVPAALAKGHPLNPPKESKTEDQSVLPLPSHAILGHLGIRSSIDGGLIATTITTRYKHKVTLAVIQVNRSLFQLYYIDRVMIWSDLGSCVWSSGKEA